MSESLGLILGVSVNLQYFYPAVYWKWRRVWRNPFTKQSICGDCGKSPELRDSTHDWVGLIADSMNASKPIDT